jgi:hypothetical protein
MQWVLFLIVFAMLLVNMDKRNEIERETINLKIRVDAIEQKLGVKL